MALEKIKNVSGDAIATRRNGSGIVEDGETIEVPAEELYSYTASANWEPATKKAQAVHDKAAKAEAAAVAKELADRGV